MVCVLDFAFNAPIVNLERDATRVRNVFRVEAKDGDIAFVQFVNNCTRVLIVVVRNDQDRGRHCSVSFNPRYVLYGVGAGTCRSGSPAVNTPARDRCHWRRYLLRPSWTRPLRAPPPLTD